MHRWHRVAGIRPALSFSFYALFIAFSWSEAVGVHLVSSAGSPRSQQQALVLMSCNLRCWYTWIPATGAALMLVSCDFPCWYSPWIIGTGVSSRCLASVSCWISHCWTCCLYSLDNFLRWKQWYLYKILSTFKAKNHYILPRETDGRKGGQWQHQATKLSHPVPQ